jgi:predicted permease
MRLRSWFYTLPLRLRSLFRRDHVEHDLDEELAYHVEQKTAAYISRGLSPEEARRAALRDMDGIEQRKEQCRDTRGVGWIEDLLRDLRYAARTLRRSPGFTAIVVLSLALGIGANTAIFSVTDGLLLRMLPVSEPQQLVRIQGTTFVAFLKRQVNFDVFPREVYERFRDHNDVFADTFAFHDLERPEVSIDGRIESFGQVQLVSGNFFPALGVNAIIGRGITPDEDRVANPVAVISYGYWKRRFAFDSSVIGKKVTVNNVVLEIIGVTPARFFGISPDTAPDLWAPLSMQNEFTVLSRQNDVMNVMARLKPGVAAQQASAAVSVLYQQIPKDLRFGKGNTREISLAALPGGQGYSTLREQFSRPLAMLTIVVGLVLLTACANVASLLLARATARQTEMSTRLAIGAGRARLIRQLFTESFLLAVAGGIVGLAFAWWGNSALLSQLPNGASPLTWHLDARTLGFTAAVSALTGIVFGLAPALRGTRVNLAGGTRTATTSRSGLRLNKILVVSQVAMSLLLLAAAGLFVRSLGNLRNVDLGFNPERLVQVSIDTQGAGYRGPQIPALHEQLLERLSAIPGVRSVSGVRNGIIQNSSTYTSLSIPGYTPPPGQDMPVDSADVGPRFFETAGLPLLSGRDFSAADNASSPKVVIISETLARLYFPGQNPVGRRLGTGLEQASGFEIVGVAKDAKLAAIRRKVGPMMYFALLQTGPNRISAMEIRTTADPASVMTTARQQVLAINRRLFVSVKTVPQQIDDTLLQERMIGKVSALFGLLALLLASGGLYGLMAYSVARRTNEIGIRMALGAERERVLGMILRETLVLVCIGVAIGIPAVLAAGRLVGHWMDSLLFGLRATDPVTIALAALVLAVAAVLAGYVPARRASRLDQMAALRYE